MTFIIIKKCYKVIKCIFSTVALSPMRRGQTRVEVRSISTKNAFIGCRKGHNNRGGRKDLVSPYDLLRGVRGGVFARWARVFKKGLWIVRLCMLL